MRLLLWTTPIMAERLKKGEEIDAYTDQEYMLTNVPKIQIVVPLEAVEYKLDGRYTVLPKDKW